MFRSVKVQACKKKKKGGWKNSPVLYFLCCSVNFILQTWVEYEVFLTVQEFRAKLGIRNRLPDSLSSFQGQNQISKPSSLAFLAWMCRLSNMLDDQSVQLILFLNTFSSISIPLSLKLRFVVGNCSFVSGHVISTARLSSEQTFLIAACKEIINYPIPVRVNRYDACPSHSADRPV